MSFPGSASPCLAPRGCQGSFPGPDPARQHGPSSNYRAELERKEVEPDLPSAGGAAPCAQTATGHPRSGAPARLVSRAGPSPSPAAGASLLPALMLIRWFSSLWKRGVSPSVFPGWAQGGAPHNLLGNEMLWAGKSCPGLAESLPWDKASRAREVWSLRGDGVYSAYVYVCIHVCICVCMHMYVYMYVYVCIYVCICMCVCISTYVFVCICMCICVCRWERSPSCSHWCWGATDASTSDADSSGASNADTSECSH